MAVHPFLPGAAREPEAGPLRSEEIDVESPFLRLIDAGVGFSEGENGDVMVDFSPDDAMSETSSDPDDHYANLAEHVSHSELDRLAQEVTEGFDADVTSRTDWFEKLSRGIELMGMKDTPDSALGPLKIAKAATHPLLAEALVQFQARAYAELYPPRGPAKCDVVGERTPEREDQADRVSGFMNYELTVTDRAYLEESDQMVMMLGLEGSEFKKIYRDPVRGRNLSRWVRAENLLVPYSATSLETASRITHSYNETHNEYLKKVRAGLYIEDKAVAAPSDMADSRTAVTVAKDAAEGKTPDQRPEDAEHQILEQCIDLNLAGFEDMVDGEQTGVALPFIVMVEKESRRVVGIYRNWRAKDEQNKERVIWYAHFKFLPGTGFYGFGFLHTIGGLTAAATACLRIILTGGIYASVPGGLKSKDARIAGSIEIEPGVYKEVESSAEELSKALWTPDFKQPSEALFRVLGLLTELGQRFAQTTEAVVGDAKNTGPVGTTIALIEQGSKVSSGIHRRMHVALGYELRLLAELYGVYAPEEGYPYNVPGQSRQVFAQDFDDHIDVIPVSDPNIFSSTQRIALAQAKLELANNAPDLYDRREAHASFLRALDPNAGAEDIDRLMPPRDKVQRCDPVTENALAKIGKPIRVYPDQNDEAHITVHMADLQMMTMQQSVTLQVAQPVLLAHMAEHEAQKLRKAMAANLGMQLPPMNMYAEAGEPLVQELPPEIEDQIAVQSAQVMQQMLAQMQQAMAQQQAQPGEADAASDAQAREADAAGKQAGAEQDLKIKDEAATREQARRDVGVQAEVDRADAKAGMDPATIRAAGQFLTQRGLERAINPRSLAVTSRALGKSFDDVVRMIQWSNSGGQGAGPSPIASRLHSPRAM